MRSLWFCWTSDLIRLLAGFAAVTQKGGGFLIGLKLGIDSVHGLVYLIHISIRVKHTLSCKWGVYHDPRH
jgi:hypothetical protein